MYADRDEFLVDFSEFATAPSAAVTSALADAALEIDASLYLHLAHRAHGLRAAHYLALAPGGQNARLDPKADGQTTYGREFDQLQVMAASATRVF